MYLLKKIVGFGSGRTSDNSAEEDSSRPETPNNEPANTGSEGKIVRKSEGRESKKKRGRSKKKHKTATGLVEDEIKVNVIDDYDGEEKDREEEPAVSKHEIPDIFFDDLSETDKSKEENSTSQDVSSSDLSEKVEPDGGIWTDGGDNDLVSQKKDDKIEEATLENDFWAEFEGTTKQIKKTEGDQLVEQKSDEEQGEADDLDDFWGNVDDDVPSRKVKVTDLDEPNEGGDVEKKTEWKLAGQEELQKLDQEKRGDDDVDNFWGNADEDVPSRQTRVTDLKELSESGDVVKGSLDGQQKMRKLDQEEGEADDVDNFWGNVDEDDPSRMTKDTDLVKLKESDDIEDIWAGQDDLQPVLEKVFKKETSSGIEGTSEVQNFAHGRRNDTLETNVDESSMAEEIVIEKTSQQVESDKVVRRRRRRNDVNSPEKNDNTEDVPDEKEQRLERRRAMREEAEKAKSEEVDREKTPASEGSQSEKTPRRRRKREKKSKEKCDEVEQLRAEDNSDEPQRHRGIRDTTSQEKGEEAEDKSDSSRDVSQTGIIETTSKDSDKSENKDYGVREGSSSSKGEGSLADTLPSNEMESCREEEEDKDKGDRQNDESETVDSIWGDAEDDVPPVYQLKALAEIKLAEEKIEGSETEDKSEETAESPNTSSSGTEETSTEESSPQQSQTEVKNIATEDSQSKVDETQGVVQLEKNEKDCEVKEIHRRNFAKALQDIEMPVRRRSVLLPDNRERTVREEVAPLPSSSRPVRVSESSTDGEGAYDDGIIDFLGKENDRAEARLAARRQARVEAREIRMRELERVQKEQEENSDKVFDLHSPTPHLTTPPHLSTTRQTPSMSPRERPTSTNSYHSSRRSSEDSMEDGLSLRDIRIELKEVEEKFRKAMIANAQLDNEKAAHAYQVELLKDKLEDLEEAHSQLGREHRERCREHEALKRAAMKLKEELTACKMYLDERDRLIADYGLIIVGGEIDEKGEATPRELVSNQSAEVLESAGEGSLDFRLKTLAKEKNELTDEVRHLKLELEEDRSRRRSEQSLSNGPVGDEIQQTLNDYRFRLQKAEQDTSTLQATVARLESQVIRYKSAAEESEKAEDELKVEKRKLLREHRESIARIEELETSNSHLQRRMDKLKNAKSTLLKEL